MAVIVFKEFAREHPLDKGEDWGRYRHYFTPTAGGVPVQGWVHYQVQHFNSDYPVEFCAGHCDILAALQTWIDCVPELASLLTVEQPLLIGDDFFVKPNRFHPTTLYEFDNVSNETYPPEAPPELATMRKAFRDATPRFSEPRERLLIGILERELFPPDNNHTRFDEERFSVMDVATTYAEIDTWLDHEEWWVHPAVDPAPPPVNATGDGFVTVEATYEPITTLAALESIEPDTETIGIYDCRISDDMMAALGRFPSLKLLILRSSTFSAQGTAHLRALIGLEELDCKESTLCNEGLEAIAGLPALKTLDLRWNPVTDRGLEVLPSFPQLDLVRLDLDVGLFSGRALRSLVLEKLPHVEFRVYGGPESDTGGPLSASTDFSRIVLNKKMVRMLKSFTPETWRR